jgi:hypothetical protein
MTRNELSQDVENIGVLPTLSQTPTLSVYLLATNSDTTWGMSTRREPPTMGKQLVNLITCGCESSAPFL